MENELNKKPPLDEKELLRIARLGGEDGKKALGGLYNLYDIYVHDQANRCLHESEDIAAFCQEVWKRVIPALPFYEGETLRGLLGKAYCGVGVPEGIIGKYYVEFLRKQSFAVGEVDEETGKRRRRKIKAKSLTQPVGGDEDGNVLILEDIVPSKAPSPLEICIKKELAEIVKAEIMKLPKGYRYVLLMRYFDNRPLEEIANLMSISYDDARQRLCRAHKKLQNLLIERLGKNPLEEVTLYSSRNVKKKI